jgi:hypothetical protein
VPKEGVEAAQAGAIGLKRRSIVQGGGAPIEADRDAKCADGGGGTKRSDEKIGELRHVDGGQAVRLAGSTSPFGRVDFQIAGWCVRRRSDAGQQRFDVQFASPCSLQERNQR